MNTNTPAVANGTKLFNIKQNVGKVRHLVNFHDGVKVHKDNSPFFDIQTFTRKTARDKFVKELLAAGYVEN